MGSAPLAFVLNRIEFQSFASLWGLRIRLARSHHEHPVPDSPAWEPPTPLIFAFCKVALGQAAYHPWDLFHHHLFGLNWGWDSVFIFLLWAATRPVVSLHPIGIEHNRFGRQLRVVPQWAVLGVRYSILIVGVA
jgi:hypothetical protein